MDLSSFSTVFLKISAILHKDSRSCRISACFGVSARNLLLIIIVIYGDL